MGRQLASYAYSDSPPTKFYLLPVSIIQSLNTEFQATTPRHIAIINITWISFFLLLLIWEYFQGGTNTIHHTFRIKSVQLFIGHKPYNTATAHKSILSRAYFVSLFFTMQNNGVKGEYINHSNTCHPQGYPVSAMSRLVSCIWCHSNTGDTPISSVLHANKLHQIRG